MTSPRQRPLRRDNLDIETTLTRAATRAPEWELGWSQLRQAMRDAGWPSRTPAGDQRGGAGTESPCIDYADPCGDMAVRYEVLTSDLDALQEHWHLVCTSLRAIEVITRKHIPVAPPAVPACSVTTCDNHVELTPSGGYRGMERIAGIWVAKPGIRPLCAGHRTEHRRDPRGIVA